MAKRKKNTEYNSVNATTESNYDKTWVYGEEESLPITKPAPARKKKKMTLDEVVAAIRQDYKDGLATDVITKRYKEFVSKISYAKRDGVTVIVQVSSSGRYINV